MQIVKTPLWTHQAQTLEKFEKQKQVLCGWDMGTGKTIFGIERDARIRDKHPGMQTLVVAPLSTHKQWKLAYETELTGRHLVKVKVIDPKDRDAFLLNKSYDVYIMHYEALRLMHDELRKFKFKHAIFDECHRLKNRQVKQTKAAKSLKILYLTDMSGSPATDRPQDLWSILNHLKPKDYSSYWRFFHTMCDNEREWNSNYWVTKGPSEQWLTQGLKSIEPFYSRILIDDCLDLPDANSILLEVDLPKPMRKAYDEMRKDFITWVIEQGGDDEYPLVSPSVIARLSRLQQLAMATIKYNAETDKYRMEMPAPKIQAAVDMIKDNDGEQFLVFSQWKAPLALLRTELNKCRPKIESTMFTGDETGPLREESKRRFINGDARVMLATIGAGGEGVDGLQDVCRTVIFLDRSWTPTKNTQAIARLRRGGQKHVVNVVDIMAANTIDKERFEKIELKRKWVMQTLGDI